MMELVQNVCSVLAAVIVIYFACRLLKWHSVLKRVNKLPGPRRLPFIGNFWDLIRRDNVQLFTQFREWSRKHSPIYSFTLLGIPVVVIAGPDEFETVTAGTKHLQKGLNYRLVEPWLGKGLLTSSGAQWQQQRKILTPAFHFSILQQFVRVFNKETEKLIDILKEECNKPHINIVPLMSQTTLNTIAETSFGTKLDLNNQDDKNYVSAIHGMGKLLVYRIIRPWLHSNILFNLLSPRNFVEYRRILKVLHNFTNRIIKEREKNFVTFEITENNELSQRKKLAFLDLLLNAKITKGTIDDQGIKDEVNTFMFEGHDTTATAISWILRQLAIYKEYQSLLYEEIVSVLGDSKKHPELNELNELKCMERFIKETLRLYPSVPFISRYLDEDITLNGYTIPKEATIDIWIYDIHRNPKYWSDPEKFDPDRFLPENCVNRHPFAYVPFSAGPRNCIGQKFAMLELKAMLCGMVQHFTVEAVSKDDKIEIMTDMVLRPSGEINLKFIPRKA